MSEHLSGLTRRSVLSAAAAGAALVGPPSIARAGAPTGTSATADTSDLELQAFELEPPVFLFETHVPEQVRALDGSRLSISGDVARAWCEIHLGFRGWRTAWIATDATCPAAPANA